MAPLSWMPHRPTVAQPDPVRRAIHTINGRQWLAITAAGDRTICPFTAAIGWQKPGLSPLSAVLATARTTSCPKRSIITGVARPRWGNSPLHMFKAEVIHRRGPWRSFAAVEYAALKWVDWFNTLFQVLSNLWPTPAQEHPAGRRRGQFLRSYGK